jgi:hypothetical protein
MKIGDRVFIHGYVDEIRKETVIIRNKGGYFGTDKSEVIVSAKDMEPVVRCKDCHWWNKDDFPRAFPEKKTSACECPNIYGANFSRYTQEDEFCSRGERREP